MLLPARFSWDAALVDDDGMVLSERRFDRWTRAAIRRFRASEEGREAPESGWLESVFHLAVQYEGRPPAELRPDLLGDLLLDVLPRKVVMDPAAGRSLVAELRAFYAFAARSYGSRSAAACADWLTPELGAELEAKLADRSTFGFAKSLFAGGGERSRQSPLEQLLADAGGLDAVEPASDRPKRPSNAARSKNKRRRNQASRSRRKNR